VSKCAKTHLQQYRISKIFRGKTPEPHSEGRPHLISSQGPARGRQLSITPPSGKGRREEDGEGRITRVVFVGGMPRNFPVIAGFGYPPTGQTEHIPARDAYFPCYWYKVHYFGAPECIFQSLILQNFSGGWGCAPQTRKN